MTMPAHRSDIDTRVDLKLVAEMVEPRSRVLDVGCGDGSLLSLLEATRQVDGRGIELDQKNVNICVARGLSVIQGDANTDLVNYPDAGFDYAILSQTIQATRNPLWTLEELLRIGRRVIVSLPNFGHWRIRWSLAVKGRMPVTRNLPYSWYDTPNIHFCTIRDFQELCESIGVEIEQAVALNASGERIARNAPRPMWNLLGEQAVFLLKR